jgi:hypothetical protein
MENFDIIKPCDLILDPFIESPDVIDRDLLTL